MTQIKEMILKEVRARNYPEVKKLLDELDEQLEKTENLREFADEIRKIVRNLGKSNMIPKQQVENLIEEYKII